MDSGRPDESPAAPRRLARTAGSNVFGTDIAGYHRPEPEPALAKLRRLLRSGARTLWRLIFSRNIL